MFLCRYFGYSTFVTGRTNQVRDENGELLGQGISDNHYCLINSSLNNPIQVIESQHACGERGSSGYVDIDKFWVDCPEEFITGVEFLVNHLIVFAFFKIHIQMDFVMMHADMRHVYGMEGIVNLVVGMIFAFTYLQAGYV